MGQRGVKPQPVEHRFWKHVTPLDGEDCWEWQGALNSGYGSIGNGAGGTIYAHRVSYEMHHGAIPSGLVVDHRCNNPRCVNPDHLQVLTQRENCLRATSRNMMAHLLGQCVRGHVLDEVGFYVRPDGRRECSLCRRVRRRAAYLASRGNERDACV